MPAKVLNFVVKACAPLIQGEHWVIEWLRLLLYLETSWIFSTIVHAGWSRRWERCWWPPAGWWTATPAPSSPCWTTWNNFQNQNIFLRCHVSSTHFSPSSAIFWSACNENISVHCWQEILESWMLKYLRRRENYLCHLCAAIFVSGRSAAEDGDELLSLRTIESRVPATTGVNKSWAVGGAENHCNDHHYYQHYQHQQEVPLLFLSFRNCW